VCSGADGRSASAARASFENVAEFTFKSDQAGIQQFPPRHDHDVEPRGELVASEHLSDETFRPIPHDCAAQLSRGGYAQPSDLEPVGEPEEGERPTVDFHAPVVDSLVFRPLADSLASVETGQRLFAADRQALPALGATALQDQASVLGRHANQKSMRLATTTRIRLKCALTLHDLSEG